MYCPECGTYNEEKARFCRICGTRLAEDTEKQKEGGAPVIPAKKKKKKIWIILTALLLLAAAVAAALFFWVLPRQKEKNYQSHMAEGDRYLEEMNYKKAEDSYLAAIAIDPKQPEPYFCLADIYEAENSPGKAKEILQQGVEQTDNEPMRIQYDFYAYVDEVLITQDGQCHEGEYTCKYAEGPVRTYVEPVSSEKGVLTFRVRDFDNDGNEELLVLILNNEYLPAEYATIAQNEIQMRMYEYENGEVILKDEYSALHPVFGWSDSEITGIFLHENNGQIYICGSYFQNDYLIRESTILDSFVTIYGQEGFDVQEGTRNRMLLESDFDSRKKAADKMADYLDSIGLPEEAGQMKESSLRKFDFIEDVEMLLFISGENTQYGESMNFSEETDPADLGEVKLVLQLSWQEGEKNSDEQQEEKQSAGDMQESENSHDQQDAEETAGSVQETYDYLLESGDYNNYTSDWMAAPESYSILDINQDQIPEFMIHSAGDSGWSNTLLYAYDPDSQAVKMVQDIYHYADIQYSDEYKAITFSEVRSALMYGGQDYYTLDGAELTYEFSVGWESDGTHDGIGYYMYQNDTRTEISEAEIDSYFSELTEIEKISL